MALTTINRPDSQKALFGTGNDLEIYHDGTKSYIQNSTGNLEIQSDTFWLEDKTNGHGMIHGVADGAVSLYYNNLKQIETTNDGITVTNSNTNVTGAQVLLKNYNNTVGYLYGSGTSTPDFGLLDSQGHWGVKVIKDGAVELYHDNSKKAETTSYGLGITGTCFATSDFQLDDGCAYKVGTGDDLQIYHSSNENWIKADNGVLNILCDNWVQFKKKDDSETLFRAEPDGAVELYHNGTKKLQTESHGVTIETNVTTTDFNSISNGALDLNNTGDTADYWTSLFWKMGGTARFAASIKKHGSGSGADFYMHAGTTQFLNIHGDYQDIFIGNAPNWTATTNAKGMMFDTDNNGNHPFLTVQHASKTSGTAAYINFESEGGVRGRIVESGSGNDVSYDSISDYRLKENISVISDGITRLKQLKPSRFNWKSDDTNTPQDGFIAHEVQTVVPSAVSGTKDEVVTEEGLKDGTYKYGKVGDIVRQSMDYGKVTPLITAALQEAITKIETLETKVAALESA